MSTQLVDLQAEREARERATVSVLAAEANHRVANNLMTIAGLIRLQASAISREGAALSADEARTLLEEVCGRIETVGRLHRLLAQTRGDEPIDLSDYLAQVAQAAVASMAQDERISLAMRSTARCEIAPSLALPIALMVGEMVTNAVKYAHPTGIGGCIHIGCHHAPGGGQVIRVTDDGVGLPEGFDPAIDGGLGMRVMRNLAKQMRGSLTFDESGIGLTVSLVLPPTAR